VTRTAVTARATLREQAERMAELARDFGRYAHEPVLVRSGRISFSLGGRSVVRPSLEVVRRC
jgi:hypothetical protein